ncbi:MAG: hypothetical protein DWQ07_18070 [Chloroflexi bacterium]|nr:MAG: hypothetical protein DWQ07_18070 [Chloroflexota bacterium]
MKGKIMEPTKLDNIISGWAMPKMALDRPEFVAVQKAVFDQLALGKPVSLQDVIVSSGLDQDVAKNQFELIKSIGAGLNDSGEIESYVLSIIPTMTKFTIDTLDLYAWCALDSLFLPGLINKTARVQAICPTTGGLIELTVTPKGVTQINSPEAVLTVEIPSEISEKERQNRKQPIGANCDLMHFFSSEAAAEEWVGARNNVTTLSIAEGWLLAKNAWIDPFMAKL